MAEPFSVELSAEAERMLERLDPEARSRVLKHLNAVAALAARPDLVAVRDHLTARVGTVLISYDIDRMARRVRVAPTR